MSSVTDLPSRSAWRFMKIKERYEAALADEEKGRQAAIDAIIEYGEYLLEGRRDINSNRAFAAWVIDMGLDQGKPWDSRHQRTAAMNIARLAAVRNNHSSDSFADCPYSTPTNIMAWHRKQHPTPEALAKAAEHAREKQVKAEQATALSEDEQIAKANFSDKSKITMKKALAIYKKRLEQRFHDMLGEEVRKQIAAADDAMRKAHAELVPKYQRLEASYQELVRSKGVFTQAQFRQLQMAVHPDNTASVEVRSRLLDMLVKNEQRLVIPNS